jgi:hypothetical protein
MNIQSIQKTMAQIGHGILTALFNGLAAFGCGMVGLPYEIPRDTRKPD